MNVPHTWQPDAQYFHPSWTPLQAAQQYAADRQRAAIHCYSVADDPWAIEFQLTGDVHWYRTERINDAYVVGCCVWIGGTE